MKLSMELRELHDELLALKPEAASHDAVNCSICTPAIANLEGGAVDKTYTEDELKAAVAAATESLKAEISTLRSSTEKAEFDKAISEAVAPFEAKVTELEGKLDTAVLEAQKYKGDYEVLVSYLEGVKAEEAEKAEIAARKESRLAAVREVASFPDSYIDENAERWAAWDEDTFEAALADWKAIAGAKKEVAPSEDAEIPVATAMVASRTAAGATKSAISEVLSFRSAGIDPRGL